MIISAPRSHKGYSRPVSDECETWPILTVMDLQSEVELCAPPCFGTEALFGTLLQEISIKLPQKKRFYDKKGVRSRYEVREQEL